MPGVVNGAIVGAQRSRQPKAKPKAKRKPSAKSLANLKPATKGEVRNPTGINGWSKMREKAAARIAEDQSDMMDTLVNLAKSGDVQALRLALGPVLNVQQNELSSGDGEPVTFRWKREDEE